MRLRVMKETLRYQSVYAFPVYCKKWAHIHLAT